jgi:hypothetical protein
VHVGQRNGAIVRCWDVLVYSLREGGRCFPNCERKKKCRESLFWYRSGVYETLNWKRVSVSRSSMPRCVSLSGQLRQPWQSGGNSGRARLDHCRRFSRRTWHCRAVHVRGLIPFADLFTLRYIVSAILNQSRWLGRWSGQFLGTF